MRTYTPAHAQNQNELWSDYSPVVSTDQTFSCANVTQISQSECQALVQLYIDTGGIYSSRGKGWSNYTWFSNHTPCEWIGLTCENGHVVEILLPNTGLFVTALELTYLDALRNLPTLRVLNLSGNAIDRGLPAMIGELRNLTQLNLQDSELRGAIPSELSQLTGLTMLDLGYNALSTDSAPLRTWLTAHDPDWEATQTLPPPNITLSPVVNGQMTISWTPILYSGGMGYYQIFYATALDGSWSYGGQTVDKVANTFTISGLMADTTYYVRLRTHSKTPFHFDVTSDYSPIVSNVPVTLNCAATEIPQRECEALRALYTSTSGPAWHNHSGWLATNTPCSWYGVTCRDGYLDEISLISNGLHGTIPSELGDLTQLRNLTLVSNQLIGTIPPALGKLSALEQLALLDNKLEGAIPPELGKLSKLQGLYLFDNQLSGPIPPELGKLTSLQTFVAIDNQLSGPIPPELGALVHLQTLVLFNNQLSGPIPPELGQLINLEEFQIQVNRLDGRIPASLGNLTKLHTFSLSSNYLHGDIPSAVANLANLIHLQIGDNALTTTDATLRAWLDQLEPSWEATQTVPPTNIILGPRVNGAITISWTPILYATGTGYYEISYATTPSGPFVAHGVTPDKTSSTYVLTGLAPDVSYFIRLRTYTARQGRPGIWSDYSPVINSSNSLNLLQNGSFETGVPPWLFYSSGGGSLTTAVPAYEGNAAGRVAVRSVSSNVQLYQAGFPLEPQTRYRLRFAAYSSSGHDLALVMHRHSAPYTNYGLNNFRINLSPGWQTFTVAFTTRNLHQLTTDTRLRFWLAPYAQAGDLYWIDGVVLEKVTATDAQITPAVSSYGTVTGTVQLPAGHDGTVTLTLIDLDSDGARFTQTTTAASDGAFAFSAVPAGTYELRATGPAGTLLPEPYQLLVDETPAESLDFVFEVATDTLYLPLINR